MDTTALFVPTHRRPTTPGEMLVEEFLEPLGISQVDFAKRVGITPVRLNGVVKGKRALTVDTAMRFARALGTSIEFWMRLQVAGEIYEAQNGETAKAVRKIKPLLKAAS
jgi:addiction module HigA family antidote